MADTERTLAISPIVQDSVQHNTQVISNIRSLTASLFGVASGILGLESYAGFLFYLLGSGFVSGLIWYLKIYQGDGDRREKGKGGIGGKGEDGGVSRYFQNQWSELWAGEVVGGLSSFVLTWTLFYGLVRA